MPTVDEITLKRLTVVKQLYRRALLLSKGHSTADKLLSVIIFDLSVETVLKTIVRSFESQKNPSDNFEPLLNQVDDILKKQNLRVLSDRANILRSHSIRNDAQHDARYPTSDDLSDCQTYTRDFLKKVTKEIWNLEFEEISMVDLIQDSKIKINLTKAEEALSKADYKTAVEQSMTGLQKSLNAVGNAISGSSFSFSFQNLVTSDSSGKFEVSRDATKAVKRMQTMLEHLALGLNYLDFMKLKQISGTPSFSLGNEEPSSFYGTKTNLDEKDAEFAVTFSIESILSIESKVGDIRKPFGKNSYI